MNQTNTNTDLDQSWLGNKEIVKELYDFNARTYDPSTGRFNGVDPIEGTQQVPLTQNPYLHGMNNPNSYPDPNGMLSPALLVKFTPAGRVSQVFQLGTRIGSPVGKWISDNYIAEESTTKNGNPFANMSNNPYGGGFNGNGGGVKTPTNNKGLPILYFDYKYKNKDDRRLLSSIAIHIQHAQATGHPNILTRGTTKDTKQNRAEICKDKDRKRISSEFETGKGGHYSDQSCDEYPFASSKQSGTGASMLGVYKSHNNSQGGTIGPFYREYSIKPGDSYIVKTINEPALSQRPKTLPEN